MVVKRKVRMRTMTGKVIEKEGMLDTGSRWTWIRGGLADELKIKLTDVKKRARTADDRLVEALLADEPLYVELLELEARLWITPCVADRLAEDVILGNDFMEKVS